MSSRLECHRSMCWPRWTNQLQQLTITHPILRGKRYGVGRWARIMHLHFGLVGTLFLHELLTSCCKVWGFFHMAKDCLVGIPICKKYSFEPKFGARPSRGWFRSSLLQPVCFSASPNFLLCLHVQRVSLLSGSFCSLLLARASVY